MLKADNHLPYHSPAFKDVKLTLRCDFNQNINNPNPEYVSLLYQELTFVTSV